MRHFIRFCMFATLLLAAAAPGFLEALALLKDNDASNDTYAVSLLTEQANDQNLSDAAYLLGYYYKTPDFNHKDLSKSHYFYLKAAQMGDKEAMLIVGWNYYKGIGCKADLREAQYWLEKVAILGDETAEEMLRFIYR